MEFTTKEIVYKLNGSISPIGETLEDNKRFENLKEMCELVSDLITDIQFVSKYKDSHEYSVNRAGKYADKFLNDLPEQFKYI